MEGEEEGAAEEAFEERLRRAMVQLEVDVPLVALADGVHSMSFAGARSHSRPPLSARPLRLRACQRRHRVSCWSSSLQQPGLE